MQLLNKGITSIKVILKICRKSQEVLKSVTWENEEETKRMDGRQRAKSKREEFLCIQCQTEWAH